jgi:hypothetical protein
VRFSFREADLAGFIVRQLLIFTFFLHLLFLVFRFFRRLSQFPLLFTLRHFFGNRRYRRRAITALVEVVERIQVAAVFIEQVGSTSILPIVDAVEVERAGLTLAVLISRGGVDYSSATRFKFTFQFITERRLSLDSGYSRGIATNRSATTDFRCAADNELDDDRSIVGLKLFSFWPEVSQSLKDRMVISSDVDTSL